MVDYYVEKKGVLTANKRMNRYMLSYLDIITTISSILLIRANTEEALEKKKALLEYIRRRINPSTESFVTDFWATA